MKENLVRLSKAALMALIALFAPAGQAIATTVALCFVDLVTGLLASKKSATPLTSSGLKKTVIKLLVYLSAISLSFLVQTYLTGPYMPVMTFVTSVIGFTELTSILENINIVAGGNLLTNLIQTIDNKTNDDQD
jgi:phage-related holin